MSIQSFQRRNPWIMAPAQWLSTLTTPERWPFLPASLASGITRLIAFDTTGLGRALQRLNPFSRIREAVLPRSAALRSLDWHLRKLFWTAVWCGMVIFQGWPRRAPRLRQEPPIRLLSAPETYADFKAPTLVVPDNVPHAEKSLLNRMTVQFIHVLQAIYPLVKSNHPASDPDPQQRFNDAYTFPSRLVRDAPLCHPSWWPRQKSRNARRAFGRRAVVKPLERREDDVRRTFDLKHFANYEVRDGFAISEA